MNYDGIILKYYNPKRNKFALLDRTLGRIDAAGALPEMSVGSWITYHANQRQMGFYFIDHVKLEDMPLTLARHDVLFLHHVLEICFFFIPIGSCVAGIFDLLVQIFDPYVAQQEPIVKKLFLAKLLITIGFYPESSILNMSIGKQLVSLPIDMIPIESLDLDFEKCLDRWLSRCVGEHPSIEYFNTVNFLTRNR